MCHYQGFQISTESSVMIRDFSALLIHNNSTQSLNQNHTEYPLLFIQMKLNNWQHIIQVPLLKILNFLRVLH